ncbi:hypothetical protein [Aliidiomarina soli]|uniref:Uncharacterized protein n=1 Tax=Aliidiomarina soli TaxID=1928574 RepID=A0A432WM91_9GAMM|nr:hypothetical protein [Aliidiomarina soli]RUO34809.1 hypothetical protein CWE14_02080 [Aliidiomarina soli]
MSKANHEPGPRTQFGVGKYLSIAFLSAATVFPVYMVFSALIALVSGARGIDLLEMFLAGFYTGFYPFFVAFVVVVAYLIPLYLSLAEKNTRLSTQKTVIFVLAGVGPSLFALMFPEYDLIALANILIGSATVTLTTFYFLNQRRAKSF